MNAEKVSYLLGNRVTKAPNFFKNRPTTPEQSLRAWDVVAREELGRDVYILACHTVGNARNVIGLVDGARLSNDGFLTALDKQFNKVRANGSLYINFKRYCPKPSKKSGNHSECFNDPGFSKNRRMPPSPEMKVKTSGSLDLSGKLLHSQKSLKQFSIVSKI